MRILADKQLVYRLDLDTDEMEALTDCIQNSFRDPSYYDKLHADDKRFLTEITKYDRLTDRRD